MNRSTPGLPVHHQLPKFTQTHVHRGSDAIQPSHPLSSPSPPAPNPSQHQGLFQWVNSFFFFLFFFKFYFIFKIYITVLVLPNIKMNPPQVYMCSPSWTLLHPPSPTLCMRWPKYWSFSFSISPSNEYPGLIAFRMDWLDLLVVQGTLKSLLQHSL